ncbi:MAG: cell wall hydrolase [Bdellovibrionaceae bacterium]|nr:cell wall hydrolase [Pseudobdellovibrionaceae bacterium]
MKRWIISASLLATTAHATNKINCEQVKNDDLMCLACNIYHESGNQSLNGKIAVGAVTINRVKSLYYPNSICRVVWQKKQFSWTNDGKPDLTGNTDSWKQSKKVATKFLKPTGRPFGIYEDPTQCALFYHADYVSPSWRKGKYMKKTTKIENHIFYRNVALGCPTEDTLAVSLTAIPPTKLNN